MTIPEIEAAHAAHLDHVLRTHVAQVLERHNHVVRRAAPELGVTEKRLRSLVDRLGLERERGSGRRHGR